MTTQREKIQNEAFETWKSSNKKGTIVLHTGLGKSFLAIRAMLELDKNKSILFLAETTVREKTILQEIKKYNKLFKVSAIKDKNFIFACYQSVYKWKDQHFDLVICDEIADQMSPAYSQFFKNNTCEQLIGLTATPKEEIDYEGYTKGDLYKKYCPIIFRYELEQGVKLGTSRKLNVFIIQHILDNKEVVKAKGKKSFTERTLYEYWDKLFRQKIMSQADEKVITFFAMQRANVLYNLQSKITLVKSIVSFLQETGIKSIVFGNSVTSLLKITKNTVSSRYPDYKNEAIIDKFNNDEIDLIASFKMLKQGVNLNGLDAVVLHSYYGKSADLAQRTGRLRVDGEKVGNLIILVTMHTQEENWMKKILSSLKEDEGYIDYFNCFGVEDFKIKFKKANS